MTENYGNGHRLRSLTLVPKAEGLAAKDFKSDQEVRWCPGCGDYAILAAFQAFLPELQVPRENVVVVSGIGCSSRLPYYVSSYGMHSIHGRAPAIASGLASSRQDLSVWVITGDGDALSIGGNHLIHALRRNVNIKIMLFNNRIYGLTKGQYSPTSEQGKVTKSTPYGSLDHPFNPLSLALGAEASFVARSVDSDRKHLQSVMRAAADHKGSAFIEIYQNCPIFNDDAFAPIKEPKAPGLIRLAHGEQIRFGPDGSLGLTYGRYGAIETVLAGSVPEDELIVHDATRDDPSTRSRCPAWTATTSPTPRSACSARSSGAPTTTRWRPRSRPLAPVAKATWDSCSPAVTPGKLTNGAAPVPGQPGCGLHRPAQASRAHHLQRREYLRVTRADAEQRPLELTGDLFVARAPASPEPLRRPGQEAGLLTLPVTGRQAGRTVYKRLHAATIARVLPASANPGDRAVPGGNGTDQGSRPGSKEASVAIAVDLPAH